MANRQDAVKPLTEAQVNAAVQHIRARIGEWLYFNREYQNGLEEGGDE